MFTRRMTGPNILHTACDVPVQKILVLKQNLAQHPSASSACGAMRVPAAVLAGCVEISAIFLTTNTGIPGISRCQRLLIWPRPLQQPSEKSTSRGITSLPPPSPAFPWTWMRPTCRCWSAKESGGSGRGNRCCIWKSGRFREAKLRRGAAGVRSASRCASGTSEHRHTVIFGHRRTDSLTLHTGFYWVLY